MSVYRVLQHGYIGHGHGDVFEATLDEAAERRAIARGAIELIERSVPALLPGSYTQPRRMAQIGGEQDAHQDPDQIDGPDGE